MYALLGNLLLRPLAREDTACLGGAFWRGFPLAAANRRMESALCSLGARSEAAAEDEAAVVREHPATWAPAAAERARECCEERGYDAFCADVLDVAAGVFDWDVGLLEEYAEEAKERWLSKTEVRTRAGWRNGTQS